ncbi:hypothetical protein A4S05_32260 [Nostoc sp. KVJ20]|uniref:pentapeptide repeat-containing protein n=1 Tax=Nostoc sp. KVJ20 TaxID=457944 RepID=UPI00083DAB69|nr:pentapeptide repeat-containing protein [Nostoc sp. KVJ20]ODH00655.1 hypothetical protein A4S05_32260 [Nostoc sp. KVJ20]
MVNEKHYARLNKGVQVWNEWILENLSIIPDLSKANFIGANLSEANLSEANLMGANLSKADLSKADLSRANLMGANLSEACLMGANLSEACLMGTNLSGVDFSKLDFSDANLSGANLSGANLSGASLIGADLIGANLNKANLIVANLTGANLNKANLIVANLNRANLNKANLIEANLTGANLWQANLSEALLRRANLSELDLTGANLTGANLTGANLWQANLSGLDLSLADLSDADLIEADLIRANLSYANLSYADLRDANLSHANLSYADLTGAKLTGSKLTGANFSEADLSGLDLNGLDFSNVDLSRANLSRTQALETDFTNAKFTGACLEDWNINSATKLNDIDCQYVYLRSDEQERRPSSSSKEFTPGEFTKLFQKALETVDLIFADGIDWKAFLLSFQELQAEYGEENLSVQAIEKKSGGAFVIRLEVPPEANKADIESQAKALYEIQLKALEARYHAELQAKNEQIVIYLQQNATLEKVIDILGNKPIQNIINVTATSESKSMSESYQSKYDQRNSNNQFVDTAQTGSNPTFNQQNFSQNINQSINDITRLINSLRDKAQEFPQDKREEVLVHLDDLQEDINKPEKQKPERIKTRIIALITIAGTVFGVVANSADFTNNVLEIADKLGIPIPTEISQPQRATQQLPPPSH